MSKIEQILSQEVTRRQFLAMVGVSLASLFGFSTIMGILTGNDSKSGKTNGPPDYGTKNYGP